MDEVAFEIWKVVGLVMEIPLSDRNEQTASKRGRKLVMMQTFYQTTAEVAHEQLRQGGVAMAQVLQSDKSEAII